MVFSRFTKTLAGAVLLGTLLLSPTMAAAQDDSTGATLADQWEDFIHYVIIARADAALSYGRAILASDPDPRAIYALSRDTENVETALARATRLDETQPGLADVVIQLRELIEQGYDLERRDPQRIAEAIDMLDGTLLQVRLATERLKASGEFALPQLLQTVTDDTISARMRERIITLLPLMGLDAVRPLSAALDTENPELRVLICRTLGRIGYPHAAPYLKRVAENPDELPRVVEAARSALLEVVEPDTAERSVANLFYALAEGYYNHQQSLRPDSRYDMANVWRWESGLGLTYTEVPREIFMDVYTMRSARQALQADETFAPAVSLWLAGNIRKEVHLPAGQDDPLRGEDQIDAKSYAKAAGAQYCQAVLIRALLDGDTAVAQEIIIPLRQVSGNENIIVNDDGMDLNGQAPLVAAMSYPDLEVRFRAAHALANAQPTRSFEGDEMVVRVMIEALRQTGEPTAMLIDPDTNRRNGAKDMIRQAGYDVIDGPNLAATLELAEVATGVDVILLQADMASPGIGGALDLLRTEPAFILTPVVLLADEAEMRAARNLANQDDLVTLQAAALVDAETMAALLHQANAGMGEMDAATAAEWALTAAQTIEMLGQVRTEVFDLTLAQPALIDGLADPRDELKVACAQALAVLRTPASQQAIVRLAGDEQVDAAVRAAAFEAAAHSVRLIGNNLTDAQARAVVEFVQSDASLDLRDAASGLLGALNLPSEQIQGMITSTAGND